MVFDYTTAGSDGPKWNRKWCRDEEVELRQRLCAVSSTWVLNTGSDGKAVACLLYFAIEALFGLIIFSDLTHPGKVLP